MLVSMALKAAAPQLCPGVLRVVASLSHAPAAQSTWSRAYSAEAGSLVKEINNDADFQQEIKHLAERGGLGVVDFTAKWCGPCRAVAPLYEQLSKQHPNAVFLKVDIDNEQLQRTVMDHGITGVPTFAFYKGGQRVESFTGARVDLLKATVEKLSK